MAVITIQTVPDAVKKQFKEVCQENKVSMARVLVDAMVDYILSNVQTPNVEEVEAERFTGDLLGVD